MKRTPIYSRAARKQRSSGAAGGEASRPPGAGAESGTGARSLPTPGTPAGRAPGARLAGLRALAGRHERALLVLSSALLTACLLLIYSGYRPTPQALTQKDIDAAVMHTLQNATLPSPEVKAVEKIRPSVVRVTQESNTDAPGKPSGVGTGVVIIENGTILTSLHVIEGARKLRVRFYNGLESDAVVLSRKPENDLAVIRATTLPDDLLPATLSSSQGLEVGERVAAVGFPFNIGPSASSGIVSGLKRVYRAPDGGEVLKDLIQFDAAANPGNSGGPLITMEGEVVGIVTAILSPHEQGTFIGIGFAVPIESAAAAAGESPF